MKRKKKHITIALAGNPNAGKTTIFNALTGSREHVGNYAGVTVEKKEGIIKRNDITIRIFDLPGTYSLTAYSLDEVVARDSIIDEKPDVIIDVIDSTNLERNLYLCLQFQEMSVPIVGALNMSDEAEMQGIIIDEEHLSRVLGIPMVKTVGSREKNIDALLDLAIRTARGPKAEREVDYGREVEQELRKLSDAIKSDASFSSRYDARWTAIKLLEKDTNVLKKISGHGQPERVEAQVQKGIRWLEKHFNESADVIIAEQRYAYIRGAVRESVRSARRIPGASFTDRIDRVLLNRIAGLPIFLLIVWGMFQLTFTLGEFPMHLIESFFSWLASFAVAVLPDTMFRSLLVDGVIGGVGGILTFLPNILLLFLCISFLEDTGYMARAAFLMDRVMHRVGLHGQSFIPLLTGFGCSVPAILAARTLRNEKDRITTILIIPLMSCGAKLPVYTLLIGAFFAPSVSGNVLFSIYLIGVLLAVIMAILFRGILFRGESSPFVMELPPYRLPTVRAVLTHIGERAWIYIRKAGTLILAASVLIWFLTSFPKPDASAKGPPVSAVEASFAGRIGKFIEPAIHPLGFDWKTGIALITGFVAKETIVSTMGTIYKVEGDETASLRKALAADKHFNPLIAFCLMIFVLIYVPCLTTLAVVKQELGSYKWVAFFIAYTTMLAWVVTFLIYAAGRFLGLGA
ncbi:MAG: ferrous iron transport protein B [Spirochaetota bacterium]